jgi:hypothetical protein
MNSEIFRSFKNITGVLKLKSLKNFQEVFKKLKSFEIEISEEGVFRNFSSFWNVEEF